ncbi:hypothetical protein SAMN05444287_0792 [Octadecabacter temperatus]|uniref:Uncharacterized protein n=1 Tax=Octadecabacter temperatus TaxID=1458307 RepID=A0A0K0Y422_9RHOB|nr:hypothetical protein [Octadecabacter temperatus]AKS45694.1 hypothetical protein OSB_11380 [Octadecabacter temperatus]SIN98504.1 hypothetical protein SAMN05444287_0792 [Octadecabacter temperatus]
MPFIIALLGIIGAAYFWAQRARNARDVVGDVADMANDVRLAARRFGFSRKMNVHPVENIEDPRLAIAAIGAAFIELDDLPTAEQRKLLQIQIRSKLRADAEEAEEMEVLGRWFMSECGGADPAVARISRKLYKIGGAEQMEPLLELLKASVTTLSDRQRDALDDIKRAMRVR